MKAKEMEFLKAMLEESTISKASEKARISRKTAYSYLQKEEFKRELNKRRMESIEDSVRYLQGKLSLFNETLISIIENPNTKDQIKVNAMTLAYSVCTKMTETLDITNRLEAIENSLLTGGSNEADNS